MYAAANLLSADLCRANPQALGDCGFVTYIRDDIKHQPEYVLCGCVDPEPVDSQERQANHVGGALVRVDVTMVLRDAEDIAGRTFEKTSAGVLEPMPSASQCGLDAAVIEYARIAPVLLALVLMNGVDDLPAQPPRGGRHCRVTALRVPPSPRDFRRPHP